MGTDSTCRYTKGDRCELYRGHVPVSMEITNTPIHPSGPTSGNDRSTGWLVQQEWEPQVSVNKGARHSNHTIAAQWNATEAITPHALRSKDRPDTFLSDKGKEQRDRDRLHPLGKNGER